jgi:serine/threonine protein kinase
MERHGMHHHYGPPGDEFRGTNGHRGNNTSNGITNNNLQHGRGRKVLRWAVMIASVLAIISLQNMFWYSLSVIPRPSAFYTGNDQIAGTSKSLFDPDAAGDGGSDGVDERNASFVSTYHSRLPPLENPDGQRVARRVVVLRDQTFPSRPWPGNGPGPTLGILLNSTMANLGASYNDTIDQEQDTIDVFILSPAGTIIMGKREDDGRYRDFEREWFQKCKPITDPDQEASNDDTANLLKRIRPTCNSFHELDVIADGDSTNYFNSQRTTFLPTESIELLSMQGSWRSVWKVTSAANYSTRDSDSPRSAVLKLLQLNRDFDEESYSIHQMDAIVMESLTASPHIVDSYGFCGQSVLTAYAESSGRSRVKDPKLRWLDRLRIARDLAQGLSDLHALQPTDSSATGKQPPLPLIFAHHDINIANMITGNDGRVQWNDFNLGIVSRQRRTPKKGQIQNCPIPIRYAGPLWRSPEEIKNETGYLTDMQAADVYSLGNVLFQVLTKHQPWSHLEIDDNNATTTNSLQQTPVAKVISSNDTDSRQEALRMIAQSKVEGRLPNVPDRYLTRNEAQVLWDVIKACYHINATARPTASEVAVLLGKAYDKYNRVSTTTGK